MRQRVPIEIQKQRARDRARAWYYAHREQQMARRRNEYWQDPEKAKAQSRKWRELNPEKLKSDRQKRYRADPEGAKAAAYKYLCTEKRRAWVRAYSQRRNETIPQCQAYGCCIRAVGHILSGALSGTRASKYLSMLGCTPSAFRAHLEAKFKPGMSWENRGRKRGCWQVDHVRGAYEFDLTKPEELAQFFPYTNTQPLWADENNGKRGGAQ